MIEILRKGFRFDINPNQVVTFKKSQNLNGIQERYAYSNTIPMDLTANNRKLLELFYLPTNKASSLMKGYEVDIILNGSIQLRNQTLKIQKEDKDKVQTYLLFSDNALVIKLKASYVSTEALQLDTIYDKTILDFMANLSGEKTRTALVETQPKSGLFVIEEMPILINLQELMRKIFMGLGYTVFGDFFSNANTIKEYFIAPNKGVYQIYTGSGFAPLFDPVLTSYELLTQVLKYFNCYADVDDTNRSVVINSWSNLANFKTNFVDYSKYYNDYQDYSFQSKLAKRNELTYSDSGTTYNSFFSNNLSDQEKATYLASGFGTGSANLFNDSELQTDGTIPVRENGEDGEISAVRVYKISEDQISTKIYANGVGVDVTANRAMPVSMLDVYEEFHKDYTDFILTPLIGNIIFRYDDILAATFSMTKAFFIEQLSSYWIPLEINFSTKKDRILVKAFLVKKRKVESPILNNFNSIILDFKEKASIPLSVIHGMYPEPPNKYPWDIVIFRSYNDVENSLFVNDILIPADSLPQAFAWADIVSVKLESNPGAESVPDKNTDSLYIAAIDTNGGVSNDAYINIQHSGVGRFESNFAQLEPYDTTGDVTSGIKTAISPLNYTVGGRPNLNNTVTSMEPVRTSGILPNSPVITSAFDLIIASEEYTNVKVRVSDFKITLGFLRLLGKNTIVAKVKLFDGVNTIDLTEFSMNSFSDPAPPGPRTDIEFNIGPLEHTIPTLAIGSKIRVYIWAQVTNANDNVIQNIVINPQDFKVDISVTKTI